MWKASESGGDSIFVSTNPNYYNTFIGIESSSDVYLYSTLQYTTAANVVHQLLIVTITIQNTDAQKDTQTDAQTDAQTDYKYISRHTHTPT